MRITGEIEAGEALLRDSLARAPENAGARLNLVVMLLQEERSADALALLEAAPALPDDRPPEAFGTRGNLLDRTTGVL